MTCKNSHQTAVNTIVTLQAQILTQWNYATEKSVQNIHDTITSVDNYDFIMQPYETISRIKLRKTMHRSRTYYRIQSIWNKTCKTVISLHRDSQLFTCYAYFEFTKLLTLALESVPGVSKITKARVTSICVRAHSVYRTWVLGFTFVKVWKYFGCFFFLETHLAEWVKTICSNYKRGSIRGWVNRYNHNLKKKKFN